MGPVDRAVVMGYRAERLNARIDPGMVFAFAAHSPGTRFPVIGIDASSDSALVEAQNAAKKGAIGINLSPGDQGVRPTDERVSALLEYCAHSDHVVFINNPGVGAPGCVLEWTDPALFDDAARSLPGLKLVFGDLARAYSEQTLLMMAKHENVFATTESAVLGSWKLRNVLLEAFEMNVCHKLLFASGFPRVTPEQAIERIYGVSTSSSGGSVGGATVPRETLRSIIERDSFAALGINASAGGVVVEPKQEGMEVQRAHL
jgi:predicted TIM-barrel fold metal-dependent hydrolase